MPLPRNGKAKSKGKDKHWAPKDSVTQPPRALDAAEAVNGPSGAEDLETPHDQARERRWLERWLKQQPLDTIPEGSQLLSMEQVGQDAPEGASGVERELDPAKIYQLFEAVALSMEQVGQPESAEPREVERESDPAERQLVQAIVLRIMGQPAELDPAERRQLLETIVLSLEQAGQEPQVNNCKLKCKGPAADGDKGEASKVANLDIFYHPPLWEGKLRWCARQHYHPSFDMIPDCPCCRALRQVTHPHLSTCITKVCGICQKWYRFCQEARSSPNVSAADALAAARLLRRIYVYALAVALPRSSRRNWGRLYRGRVRVFAVRRIAVCNWTRIGRAFLRKHGAGRRKYQFMRYAAVKHWGIMCRAVLQAAPRFANDRRNKQKTAGSQPQPPGQWRQFQ